MSSNQATSNPFGAYVPKSGGGDPASVFRGQFDVSGNPVYEDVETDSGKYINPPSGHYTLMVTGFSEPKENSTYPNKDGSFPVQTSVELEITEGAGKGIRFFWNYQTWSLSPGGGKTSDGKPIPPSNLCRIYMAAVLNGNLPQKGMPLQFTDLIGKPFVAFVTASQDMNDKGQPKFAKIAKDTIAPAAPAGKPDPFTAALAQAS